MDRFDKFTLLISNINRYIQKVKSFEMEEFGLKGNQVQCLYHLYKKKDGLSATKLCSLCKEDKGAISRTIKELEKLGFIYIGIEGEQKYRNPLKLTPKGETLGKNILKKIEENVLLASSGISESQRETLYFSLEQISNNLEKICKENKND